MKIVDDAAKPNLVVVALKRRTEQNFHIAEDDIRKKLSNLNLNKSPGPDSIHPRVLYEVRFEICTHL